MMSRRREHLARWAVTLGTALLGALPAWLFSASSRPPFLLGASLAMATHVARRPSLSRFLHRFTVALVVGTAGLCEHILTDSLRHGHDPLLLGTVIWAVGLAVLPGSIGIVVLVNTCALVVALVVAELGVQLVTGRRLSSEEMLAEFRREAGGPTLDPDRRITTTDDLRTTIGQPGGDAPRVYVFGGSTIYGGEVDDAETIPSMLQGRLNSVDVSATVLNYGQVMVDAVYSNAWLQSLTSEARPRPGDVVVFYVGVNDAGASFAYLSRIDRWSAEFDNLAAPMRTLNRRSAIASQTFAWLGRGRVTANDQTSSLRAALDDARTFAESLGARFVAILQPTLFTERAPDEYERTLVERLGRDLVRAVDEIYPIVSEVVLASPGAVDARGALSAVEPSPFVDWMHLDGRGNAAIAAMMEAAVTPLLVP